MLTPRILIFSRTYGEANQTKNNHLDSGHAERSPLLHKYPFGQISQTLLLVRLQLLTSYSALESSLEHT